MITATIKLQMVCWDDTNAEEFTKLWKLMEEHVAVPEVYRDMVSTTTEFHYPQPCKVGKAPAWVKGMIESDQSRAKAIMQNVEQVERESNEFEAALAVLEEQGTNTASDLTILRMGREQIIRWRKQVKEAREFAKSLIKKQEATV